MDMQEFVQDFLVEVLCRGVLDGFWAIRIMVWNGVGFGLLWDGNKAARNGNDMELERKGIGRVWQEIEGYREMLRYRIRAKVDNIGCKGGKYAMN